MNTVELKSIDSNVMKVSVSRPYEGEAKGLINIGDVTVDIGYIVMQNKRIEGGDIIEAICFIDEDEYTQAIQNNLVNSLQKSLSQKIELLVRFKAIHRNDAAAEVFVKS